MTFTLLGDIARVILAALAIFGAATVAWGIRAAVRGWKRVPRKPRIRHGRLPLQPLEPIDLGQPDPEPGSEREANLLLARWAAEGKDHD